MYSSLNKLKALPNETLIFPGHDNALDNLVWAKTLDPNNDLLNMKLNVLEQVKIHNGFSVPTTMFEEKKINPFLRCGDKYYSELLGEKDPAKAFKKLKEAQEVMFKI